MALNNPIIIQSLLRSLAPAWWSVDTTALKPGTLYMLPCVDKTIELMRYETYTGEDPVGDLYCVTRYHPEQAVSLFQDAQIAASCIEARANSQALVVAICKAVYSAPEFQKYCETHNLGPVAGDWYNNSHLRIAKESYLLIAHAENGNGELCTIEIPFSNTTNIRSNPDGVVGDALAALAAGQISHT